MQCPACGGSNPEHAFFCGECGANLRSALGQPPGPITLSPGDATGGAGALPSGPPSPPFGPIAPAAVGEQAASLLDTPISAEPGKTASCDPTPPVAQPPQPPGFPLEHGIHGYTLGGGSQQDPPPLQPPPPVQPPQPPLLPPPPGMAPQYQAPQYQPPQYQQPQYQPPQYGPGQAYLPAGTPPPPGYGYSQPSDGNTSGMGEGYPIPPGVSGLTAAGCVPFGLFSFLNGNTLWGIISLVGVMIPPAQWVYAIYIAIQGRELAWRGRRFDNLAQFQDTMHAWSIAGLIVFGLGMALSVLYFVFLFAMMGGMFGEAFSNP